jgi:hypothetical protein
VFAHDVLDSLSLKYKIASVRGATERERERERAKDGERGSVEAREERERETHVHVERDATHKQVSTTRAGGCATPEKRCEILLLLSLFHCLLHLLFLLPTRLLNPSRSFRCHRRQFRECALLRYAQSIPRVFIARRSI